MQVPLDLSRHCIETALKRLHNRSISAYFKADLQEQARLAVIIGAVQELLESADFAALRTTWPALAGGAGTVVSLSIEDNTVTIRAAERPVFRRRLCPCAPAK